MASIKYFLLLLCFTIGYNWASTDSQRIKRQNVAFSQSSYSFSPTSCVPGVIVGSTSAPGTSYYTIASPNQYIGVNSKNGQVLLINYIALNTPQTATIRAYVGPGFNGASTTTQVTVTCVAGNSGGGSGGSGGSGGTATGIPVASQVPFVITAGTCNFGNTIGTVTVSNPAQVVFGSANSGTAFLVSSTGVITLSRAITPGTYTILVTATNPYGTTTIPVTINAGCTGSGGGGSGGSGGATSVPQFFSNSYTFAPTGTNCRAGVTIGSVAVTPSSGSPSYTISPTNSAFAISSTGAITLTGNPLPTSGSQYTFSVVATNNFGSTVVPVTVYAGVCSGSSSGTFQFQQPFFNLSPTICTGSTNIGTFTALNAPGQVIYSIDAPNLGYTISSNGQVTGPATGLVAGTITLRAVANGQTVTTAVTITRNACSGSGGTTGTLQFNQPSYSYQFLSGCTAFGVIGQVTATTTPAGRVTYSLPVGTTNNFGIDPSSGMIYATVANGQCNVLNVTARNSAGQTTTVPVYIDCTIGGSATCAAGTFTIQTTTCVPGSFSCGDIG